MTTNARHTPPPAAIPASTAMLDGDSSKANKQIKEYKQYFKRFSIIYHCSRIFSISFYSIDDNILF